MILFGHVVGGRLPAESATARREPGCWARLLGALFATIERIVPRGYQDASGFHYGQPALD